MSLKNSTEHYGLVSRLLHWVSALWIFGLFGLGVWMVTLDYYSTWYHQGPTLHKAMGLLLMTLILIRLVWRWMNPQPVLLNTPNRLMQRLIPRMHDAMYLLLLAIGMSGYLISTAEGHGISVFEWFTVPALISGDGQADWAGDIHEWLAYSLMALVALHAAGALKHHFWDKDDTLKRMVFSKKLK